MARITITEQQLAIWANHVQLRKNKETYEKVKSIFEYATFNGYGSNSFEIYLQGSVANNTNIWADGDIDIVLQFNWNFSNDAKQKLSNKYFDSTYTQTNLRNDIKSILDQKDIPCKEKNKCIKLNLKGEQ